jgi:hypothetical protein
MLLSAVRIVILENHSQRPEHGTSPYCQTTRSAVSKPSLPDIFPPVQPESVTTFETPEHHSGSTTTARFARSVAVWWRWVNDSNRTAPRLPDDHHSVLSCRQRPRVCREPDRNARSPRSFLQKRVISLQEFFLVPVSSNARRKRGAIVALKGALWLSPNAISLFL